MTVKVRHAEFPLTPCISWTSLSAGHSVHSLCERMLRSYFYPFKGSRLCCSLSHEVIPDSCFCSLTWYQLLSLKIFGRSSYFGAVKTLVASLRDLMQRRRDTSVSASKAKVLLKKPEANEGTRWGGLSRRCSDGFEWRPCRRGQELAEAERRKVHRCRSFKASVSIFGLTCTNVGLCFYGLASKMLACNIRGKLNISVY